MCLGSLSISDLEIIDAALEAALPREKRDVLDLMLRVETEIGRRMETLRREAGGIDVTGK